MASRYPLNLPVELKQAAARLAKQQGISLNQFFLWSISEKVTELRTSVDDPDYPAVTYRRGAGGIPTPVIRGTGIRVETIVAANQRWGQTATELGREYDIPVEAVEEALAYYQTHREEIDTLMRIEQEIEARHG
ncbi:MAG: DUF433 domain-containing protein [Anaerolineales bacterium]|nr:DUF433 domain-containing protein [Anaerolineales bacterium]